MPLITVTKPVHEKILEHKLPGANVTHQPGFKRHADGSVTFWIDEEVQAALAAIDPDPNLALMKHFKMLS